MAPPLIELRDVSRVYGEGESEVRALDHASLCIDEGEFVAVMGASGSGKSTCLNILGCLDQPSSGAYLFRGVDVSRLSDEGLSLLRRRYLGFVFQSFNLLARTSAQENVELPLIYRRVPAAERRVRARRALHDVGLAGREEHTPAELSGGQQQRVAIARAIVTDPAMILADEPTGNLDSTKKSEIMSLLRTLNRERGITVVMVSHEPDMAAWTKRIVTFRDGAVAEDRRQG
ncbi:Macrolide export ATP-binding/permease protein MacB [Minicystis rosea]|nr:Macrolide export ATP-binding/permease protein MacB [Minicystis rosea]